MLEEVISDFFTNNLNKKKYVLLLLFFFFFFFFFLGGGGGGRVSDFLTKVSNLKKTIFFVCVCVCVCVFGGTTVSECFFYKVSFFLEGGGGSK